MKTFYLELKVTPTRANNQFNLVAGAIASCWIQENDPQIAYAKVEFHILKYDWQVEKVECFPIEVKKENFVEKEGLEQYLRAQEEGIAIVYTALAKDGKTSAGPLPLYPSHKFSMSRFLKKQKQLVNKGRCLHYESGHRCQEIIKAHSIQRNRALSVIAEKGHVYRLSADLSTLKKNKGKPTFEKCGINKVSTFLGFCKKHDNMLFEPIDNKLLVPTDQQVLLYAYRSLCREIFVKENALELYDSHVGIADDQNVINELFKSMKEGTSFGLANLKRHKEIYDNSLKENSFFNVKYVLFISKQEPTIAFSGLFFPDFDFMGRQLQNLGNHNSNLQLITICSAPLHCGWGFLFAWHVTSSNVCVDFMRSFATMVHDNCINMGDSLFRLVMTMCENLAISPKWWERLSDDQKEQVTLKASSTADIFSIPKPFYLMRGLEGISNWEFDEVISKMED